MAEANKSQIVFNGVEDTPFQQNLSQFYKLHYRPKRSLEQNNSIGFRAKSVNAIVQSRNPQQMPADLNFKYKRAFKQKLKQRNKSKEKIVVQRKKSQKFSFKQILSKQTKNQQISEYFEKFPHKTHIDLQDYGRKNLGVKMAIQKCKDEKIKIQKVIASNKQSEQTKLDYLQLKKKDIQQEIKNEIKAIYQQFFKKQYGDESSKGYSEFQSKIKLTMEILHQQMFGK